MPARVDGSPDAEQALTGAINLAESDHSRLTLITAESQVPRRALRRAGIPLTVARYTWWLAARKEHIPTARPPNGDDYVHSRALLSVSHRI